MRTIISKSNWANEFYRDRIIFTCFKTSTAHLTGSFGYMRDSTLLALLVQLTLELLNPTSQLLDVLVLLLVALFLLMKKSPGLLQLAL